MPETETITAVPRIQVSRLRDVPQDATPVFGASLWRNLYGFRSRHGLARVPAALGDGPWEYEGRSTAAGTRHDFWHPEGHDPAVTFCHVRYMTRRECQETYRRVLTGDLTPALRNHKPLVSVPALVAILKGRVLACKCPFPPEGQPDWCHAADLAEIAATHSVAQLTCRTTDDAKVVARETDQPGTERAVALGPSVYVSYSGKQYPLDVAAWAAQHGHAEGWAAAAVTARL